MARHLYGLDLGTYEIKIYDNRKEVLWKEKTAVAKDARNSVFAVGDPAYEMYERTPGDKEVLFPMQDGVLAHIQDMQYLLKALLEKDGQRTSGSEYIVAVPTDVTQVQKRALYDLVIHSEAGAKSVHVVERGIAAAIGAGLDIYDEKAIFIADLGGATTELSMVAGAGIVVNRLVKTGGQHMDRMLTQKIRHCRDFLIGSHTAERLRIEVGLVPYEETIRFPLSGRSLLTRLPKEIEVPAEVVQDVLKAQLEPAIHNILAMLDRTPPNLRRYVAENGIWITGGLAKTKGMEDYLENILHMPVHLAKEPEFCAVNGLKTIWNDKRYQEVTYSMSKQNDRWLHSYEK